MVCFAVRGTVTPRKQYFGQRDANTNPVVADQAVPDWKLFVRGFIKSPGLLPQGCLGPLQAQLLPGSETLCVGLPPLVPKNVKENPIQIKSTVYFLMCTVKLSTSTHIQDTGYGILMILSLAFC